MFGYWKGSTEPQSQKGRSHSGRCLCIHSAPRFMLISTCNKIPLTHIVWICEQTWFCLVQPRLDSILETLLPCYFGLHEPFYLSPEVHVNVDRLYLILKSPKNYNKCNGSNSNVYGSIVRMNAVKVACFLLFAMLLPKSG